MADNPTTATATAIAVLLALAALPAQAQTVAPTTNSSAVIAAGNTFQQILAAVTNNNQRRSLTIQNDNTNGDNCWLFIGATGSATKGTSMLLGPGGSYQRYSPYVPADNIAATCTNTSDTLYADFQ
jgi:hypothetical protein